LRRTEQLNQTLSNIEEKFNLNSVALTGDEPEKNAKQNAASLYTFEGEDYKGLKDDGAQKQANLQDFIDIGPRRDRGA
jgi:hypothetical protein